MKKKPHPVKKLNSPKNTVDLTARPPRSPRVKLGDFVFLPRIIDKGRAELAGKIGEYHFGRGMDTEFFEFVGIEPGEFKAQIDKNLTDWELLQWVEKNSQKKREAWEVKAWSDHLANDGFSTSVEWLKFWQKRLGKLNSEREDIKNRFDYLDLDDYCSFGGRG